ncbi:hypothetical protein FPV67DRAFT_1699223 [Lyophyllum atratum]|nr:hypothetical protein FPV67DRAFT_1699223 [Lyophyllum atratum]
MFRESSTKLSRLAQHPAPAYGAELTVAVAAGPSKFSTAFENLSRRSQELRKRLDEFTEHTDESARLQGLIQLFENDFKVSDLSHSSPSVTFPTLSLYTGFHPTNMLVFIHRLMQDVGDDLDHLSSAFKLFNELGIPAMRSKREREAERVLTVTTVATFLSAVTATTLQMSIGVQGDTLPSTVIAIVNTFWFCSLVFSIGAALNSLLSSTWKHSAAYDKGGPSFSLRVTTWVQTSAPVFLTVSLACFSAGLVLFSFGSNQRETTFILTLVATAVTSLGFIAAMAWFMNKRWIKPMLGSCRPLLLKLRLYRLRISSKWGVTSYPLRYGLSQSPLLQDKFDQSSDPEAQQDILSVKEADLTTEVSQQFGSLAGESSPVVTYMKPSGIRPKPKQRLTGPLLPPHDSTELVEPLSHVGGTEDGEIQDLEYSHDGALLAITKYLESRGESKTIYYRAEAYQVAYPPAVHGYQAVCKQITWSEDGSKLLVRLDCNMDYDYHQSTIDILNSKCERIGGLDDRFDQLTSVSWCPSSSEDFFCMERNIAFKFRHRERAPGAGYMWRPEFLVQYQFDNILLRNIVAVNDGRLLLAVGQVVFSQEASSDLHPTNNRFINELILYDTASQKYISHDPLMDDVRHISLSREIGSPTKPKRFDVLLSHWNKPAPQLWTMTGDTAEIPMTPKSFDKQPPAGLNGQGYFARDRKEFILCVAQDGDVHVRDRVENKLVKRVPAQVAANHRRSVASCPAAKSLDGSSRVTFATVSAGGTFTVWSPVVEERHPTGAPGRNTTAGPPSQPIATSGETQTQD